MVDVTPRPTPNPNALKFTLDRAATDKRSETFREGSDPAESPLGALIFALGGVDQRVPDRRLRQRHQGRCDLVGHADAVGRPTIEGHFGE